MITLIAKSVQSPAISPKWLVSSSASLLGTEELQLPPRPVEPSTSCSYHMVSIPLQPLSNFKPLKLLAGAVKLNKAVHHVYLPQTFR
jgi:hypothetical protein